MIHPGHTAFILLGSNIIPEYYIPLALEILRQQVNVLKTSTPWENPPVGSDGPNFLNAGVAILTELSPDELSSQILRPLEHRLGRIRTADKNAPRTIDLDIIIYDGQILEPRIWTQAFITVPMAEIYPELVNLDTGMTLKQAAEHLSQNMQFLPRPEVISK